MQEAFDFGAVADIAYIRDQLIAAFGHIDMVPVLAPAEQLVRSLIGVRTEDTVSWPVFERVMSQFPRLADLAAASTGEIMESIHGVTFPEKAAPYIKGALVRIKIPHPDFDLSFLAHRSVDEALEWLERSLGIGRKISAATLNFSTLDMPAFVIDMHVLRVLSRFGVVGRTTTFAPAYAATMAAMDGWSAAELREFHALLKRLGQTFCGARETDCMRCPIGPRCSGWRQTGKSSRMRVPRSGAS